MNTPRSHGYGVIPTRAFDDTRMSANLIAVLGLLGTYADRTGRCWPSQGTLARRRGVTRQAVSKSLLQLAGYGYITMQRRQGSSMYRVLFDGDLPYEFDRWRDEYDQGPAPVDELDQALDGPPEYETVKQALARDADGRGQDWDTDRRAALARDRHACVACGSPKNLMVHHIKPFAGFTLVVEANALENLETVCRKCHASKHRELRDQEIQPEVAPGLSQTEVQGEIASDVKPERTSDSMPDVAQNYPLNNPNPPEQEGRGAWIVTAYLRTAPHPPPMHRQVLEGVVNWALGAGWRADQVLAALHRCQAFTRAGLDFNLRRAEQLQVSEGGARITPNPLGCDDCTKGWVESDGMVTPCVKCRMAS